VNIRTSARTRMLNRSRKIRHISSDRGRLSPGPSICTRKSETDFDSGYIISLFVDTLIVNLVNDSILIETDAAFYNKCHTEEFKPMVLRR
jgi:hypothetical protein